jgi:hypothetical protein
MKQLILQEFDDMFLLNVSLTLFVGGKGGRTERTEVNTRSHFAFFSFFLRVRFLFPDMTTEVKSPADSTVRNVFVDRVTLTR